VAPRGGSPPQQSSAELTADSAAFLRDHPEPLEIYRLGESDLTFGELLPHKPG